MVTARCPSRALSGAVRVRPDNNAALAAQKAQRSAAPFLAGTSDGTAMGTGGPSGPVRLAPTTQSGMPIPAKRVLVAQRGTAPPTITIGLPWFATEAAKAAPPTSIAPPMLVRTIPADHHPFARVHGARFVADFDRSNISEREPARAKLVRQVEMVGREPHREGHAEPRDGVLLSSRVVRRRGRYAHAHPADGTLLDDPPPVAQPLVADHPALGERRESLRRNENRLARAPRQ